MELLWQIPAWLIGTAIFDWVVAGRFAALAPSVDYRYWPVSKLRLIGLAILSAALAVDFYSNYQAEWSLLATLVALIIYFAAITADLERQRDRGPLPHSSRYSDSDY